MSKQSGNEWLAASVYGYTGVLRANSQGMSGKPEGGRGECARVCWYTVSKQSGEGVAGEGGGCGECARVHRLTMRSQRRSGQATEEEAASVCGYTGVL